MCDRPGKMGATRNKKGMWEFPKNVEIFQVERNPREPRYLYITVAGKGQVTIKCEDEGVVVDILDDSGRAIGSTWATFDELNSTEESDEQDPVQDCDSN